MIAERREVIQETRTWLRTPFHDNQRLKGAGCDCLGLLVGAYEACGVVTGVVPPPYSAQWHCHQKEELYLKSLLPYCGEVEKPEPADIAVFKFGHSYSHAGIVLQWPVEMIHAWFQYGVQLVNPSIDPHLKRQLDRAIFFSPWAPARQIVTERLRKALEKTS